MGNVEKIHRVFLHLELEGAPTLLVDGGSHESDRKTHDEESIRVVPATAVSIKYVIPSRITLRMKFFFHSLQDAHGKIQQNLLRPYSLDSRTRKFLLLLLLLLLLLTPTCVAPCDVLS